MAKITKKYSFSKGDLTKDGDEFILTEISKDSSSEYNLSSVLNEFVGLSGVNITISIDDEIPETTDE